ncbi:MAG: PEGA domain-containing protein [bacterium]|nr:PEGA domain-containing protein [bacterium]
MYTNDQGIVTGRVTTLGGTYAETLTPAAITGTGIVFTLGGGGWALEDVGGIIENNATAETGVAVITEIVSATEAKADITTDFTDTNAIASGDWALREGVQAALIYSNATYSGMTNPDGSFTYSHKNGTFNVDISKDGYDTVTSSVCVFSKDTTVLNIELSLT